jgi:polyisoprenoid-binding protein YceI
MKSGLFLATLLSASAAQAQRTWTVEPGQAFVAVNAPGFSAFSQRVSGRMEEREDGLLRFEVRLPLASLTSGSATQDRNVPREGELLFDLQGPGAGKQGELDLEGTVTLRGVTRPVRVKLVLTRTDRMAFGHAQVIVQLREFGFSIPAGMRDAARIELDAGLRPERVLASHG